MNEKIDNPELSDSVSDSNEDIKKEAIDEEQVGSFKDYIVSRLLLLFL